MLPHVINPQICGLELVGCVLILWCCVDVLLGLCWLFETYQGAFPCQSSDLQAGVGRARGKGCPQKSGSDKKTLIAACCQSSTTSPPTPLSSWGISSSVFFLEISLHPTQCRILWPKVKQLNICYSTHPSQSNLKRRYKYKKADITHLFHWFHYFPMLRRHYAARRHCYTQSIYHSWQHCWFSFSSPAGERLEIGFFPFYVNSKTIYFPGCF